MPRYLVERSFSDGLLIPTNDEGAAVMRAVVDCNAQQGVTWVHSYVSDDRKKTFCVYDAATPEAIRDVARSNGLPVDTITQISVLDPYAYRV